MILLIIALNRMFSAIIIIQISFLELFEGKYFYSLVMTGMYLDYILHIKFFSGHNTSKRLKDGLFLQSSTTNYLILENSVFQDSLYKLL